MIKAILFDCDGTLVDTEDQTGMAITQVMTEYDITDASIPTAWTRGQTWNIIAQRIQRLYPAIPCANTLAEELTDAWEQLVVVAPPITGAVDAVHAAHPWFALGMVTSSPGRSVGPLLEQLGLDELIPMSARVCAEHVTKSKPNPEGYLLAAEKLGVRPESCLVFEDSEAGILAARAAGMRCIAILETATDPKGCRKLADRSITHFNELPLLFWRTMAGASFASLPSISTTPSL